MAADRALTKRQRRRQKAEEEERVRAAELRQLQQPPPESEVDFERLVRCLPLVRTQSSLEVSIMLLGRNAFVCLVP